MGGNTPELHRHFAHLGAQMVNHRFPHTAPYGFELVDAEHTAQSRHHRHQSKIYGESNQWRFPRFFDELSPTQSLALYREGLGEMQ